MRDSAASHPDPTAHPDPYQTPIRPRPLSAPNPHQTPTPHPTPAPSTRTELTQMCHHSVTLPLGAHPDPRALQPTRPHGDNHEGGGPAGGSFPSPDILQPPPSPHALGWGPHFPRRGLRCGGEAGPECSGAAQLLLGAQPCAGGGSALWVKHGAYAGLHVPACLAPAPW